LALALATSLGGARGNQSPHTMMFMEGRFMAFKFPFGACDPEMGD
jgi:hypothetical protein